jgi:hypothetical protein
MLRCVALVRTDHSEENIASIIRVTRIRELGTALAVAVNDVPSSLFFVTLMMEAIQTNSVAFSPQTKYIT